MPKHDGIIARRPRPNSPSRQPPHAEYRRLHRRLHYDAVAPRRHTCVGAPHSPAWSMCKETYMSTLLPICVEKRDRRNADRSMYYGWPTKGSGELFASITHCSQQTYHHAASAEAPCVFCSSCHPHRRPACTPPRPARPPHLRSTATRRSLSLSPTITDATPPATQAATRPHPR
jgi:hypothetical protein